MKSQTELDDMLDAYNVYMVLMVKYMKELGFSIEDIEQQVSKYALL